MLWQVFQYSQEHLMGCAGLTPSTFDNQNPAYVYDMQCRGSHAGVPTVAVVRGPLETYVCALRFLGSYHILMRHTCILSLYPPTSSGSSFAAGGKTVLSNTFKMVETPCLYLVLQLVLNRMVGSLCVAIDCEHPQQRVLSI